MHLNVKKIVTIFCGVNRNLQIIGSHDSSCIHGAKSATPLEQWEVAS
jgi:hypothetical protein